MFGLVYSPWERVTTSHHGSQVFVFLLLTGTVLFLVSLLSPTILLGTSIRFIYSLKLTDTAPRAPITTGTTMTFRMRQAFKSWYFSNFSSSLSFTLSSPWMATLTMTTSLSFLWIKTMSGLLASIFRSRYHAFLYILSAPAYRTHSPHGPPFLPYFRTFCTNGILLCDHIIIIIISLTKFSNLIGCQLSSFQP